DKEDHTIRIGTPSYGTPTGQTRAFIAGITNSHVTGMAVQVNGDGQLGVLTSSRQFKDEIADMGDRSSRLMRLRPVTFFYKPEYDSGPRTRQYGLVAEEVAEVYPELVQYTEKGAPYAVRYHLMTAMLLNELQKQQQKVAAAQQQLAEHAQQVAD